MSRAFFVSVLTLSSLAMSGCKQIEMKDGQIPAAFVSEAKKAEGIYEGHIEINDGSGVSQNMRPFVLTLKIDGTHPVLTPSGDWLDDSCHSKIGDLQNVQIGGGAVKRAAFAFDAGACKKPGMGDIMMVSLSTMPNGKLMLFAWVMTGETQESVSPTSQEIVTVSTMTHGHFQQH